MIRRIALLGALAVAPSLAGCGPSPVAWSVDATRSYDFEDTRAAFTRSTAVYEGADGRLFARATWFAPRFSAALAEWQARQADAVPEERAAAVREAVDKARSQTWFFLALNTGDYAWNDLGRPDSTLKVRLQVGDAWLEPVAVERLSVDAMADRRVVFPYAGDLTVGYDVVFPKVVDPKRIRLQVVGIPGRADLVWHVQ